MLSQFSISFTGASSQLTRFPRPNLARRLITIALILPVLAGCGTSRPDAAATTPLSESRIGWMGAKQLLRSCQVRTVEQTHQRTVTLTLSDGRTRLTEEPKIDDVIHELNNLPARCPQVTLATE